MCGLLPSNRAWIAFGETVISRSQRERGAMLTRLRSATIRCLAAGLYLFAGLVVGAGHRTLAIASDPLAAYVLPDGSRPVLCLTEKLLAPGETDGSIQVEHCDACSLASAPGLPPIDASHLRIERDGLSLKFAVPNDAPIPSLQSRSHCIRGPPSPDVDV